MFSVVGTSIPSGSPAGVRHTLARLVSGFELGTAGVHNARAFQLSVYTGLRAWLARGGGGKVPAEEFVVAVAVNPGKQVDYDVFRVRDVSLASGIVQGSGGGYRRWGDGSRL